jgi:D-alanine--poly(phosphoribitol) ligase subunit 1
MDLLDRIDRWGLIAPQRVAHASGDRRLTYHELRRRSDSVAAYLREMLQADRSPVAIVGHKEPEMLIAFLGAGKSGHPYIPLDTALPEQRISRITEMAGVRVVLTPELIAGLPERALPNDIVRATLDDPYYIIFTSGSTGEPKGVVITLGCLSTFVGWMLDEQKFEEQSETFLNQAPFSFDLSVMDVYLSLVTGGTLFSIRNHEIAQFKDLFRALRTSSVTSWVSTPSFAQLCLVERSFGQSMLPQLRRFLFCGETLPPKLAAELLDRFPEAEVWNTYGPTETTVAVTSVRIDRDILARYSRLPIGFPMPQAKVSLRNIERGRGEIVISGQSVSPGYFRRPDLTADTFVTLDGERTYCTGDLGWLEDDLLFFDGRMDYQIKCNGYRIELGEIESSLRALPGVTDAIVIGQGRDARVTSLIAFVISAEATGISDPKLSSGLRSQLAAILPPYMLPRVFKFVQKFPLTPSGKVDRKLLTHSPL